MSGQPGVNKYFVNDTFDTTDKNKFMQVKKGGPVGKYAVGGAGKTRLGMAPIKRAQGWHIIKCLEIKESFTPSLADLKASLVEKMREEKVKANSQAYLAQLLQENPVTINELAIGQILENQEAK